MSQDTDTARLLTWALQSLALLALVPDDLTLELAGDEGEDLLLVTVTTGGIGTGFGVAPDRPAEARLDTFVSGLADALIEDRHGAWPPCPEHGDAHPGQVAWTVTGTDLRCRVGCPTG